MADEHVVITGANGFIGRHLLAAVLRSERYSKAMITVVDLSLGEAPIDPRVRRVEGDISDASIRKEALLMGPNVLFHLAGILGGAAEANYAISRRINVEATLSFFEDLRNSEQSTRVVFASSIAVFGPNIPNYVDDNTLPSPSMIYGAQKLMMEVTLQQFSNRGWMDGLAIRLPGIVARPGADANLKSSFLSQLFTAFVRGHAVTLPVSREGTFWLNSVSNCVESFLHAATLPPERIGERRAFTLSTQRVRMGDLVDGLHRTFPESKCSVSYDPDPLIEAQFAKQPPLSTAIADSLGFRHDGNLESLIAHAVGTVS